MSRIGWALLFLTASAACRGSGASPDGSTGAGGTGGSSGAPGAGGLTRAGGGGGSADDAGGTASDARDGSELEPICVVGGSASEVYCDLIVEGTGLDQFEGKLVIIRNGIPPVERLASAQTRIVGGTFSVTLPLAQELRIIYKPTRVVFDVDGDGSCGSGDQVFFSNATGFRIGDGGTSACPGMVRAGPQSLLSAATSTMCDNVATVCGSPDAGP